VIARQILFLLIQPYHCITRVLAPGIIRVSIPRWCLPHGVVLEVGRVDTGFFKPPKSPGKTKSTKNSAPAKRILVGEGLAKRVQHDVRAQRGECIHNGDREIPEAL
jgi:hypothetical protein